MQVTPSYLQMCQLAPNALKGAHAWCMYIDKVQAMLELNLVSVKGFNFNFMECFIICLKSFAKIKST